MKFLFNGEPAEIKFRHKFFPVPIAINSRLFGPARKRVVSAQTLIKLKVKGQWIGHAFSWCSYRDTFDYEIGRRNALRHLMEDYFLPRFEREQLWSAYLHAMERSRFIDAARLEQRLTEAYDYAGAESTNERVTPQSGATEIEEAAVSRSTYGSGLLSQ